MKTEYPHNHVISVVLADELDQEPDEYEATSSGITEPPYRLWVELSGGQRIYFMMERIAYYVVG